MQKGTLRRRVLEAQEDHRHVHAEIVESNASGSATLSVFADDAIVGFLATARRPDEPRQYASVATAIEQARKWRIVDVRITLEAAQ